MEDFLRRGGKIEYRRIADSDIRPLADRFDLLVVATGKGPLGQLFAYRPEHTPYSQPQRRLCVGLYTGVRQPDPMNVTLSVSPGHGEMIVIPTITFDGVANALLMENVPGGDMEELATLGYEDNPKHFLRVILDKLEKHHPTTYDRIDTARFDLAQPLDLLQGGVVPTVRNTVVEFDGGKCAIALGDVHSVVDPMMGQGANVASYAAFVLGEEIVHSDVLDARFCEKVDLKRQDRVLAASRWTNLMLQPPSEALGMLIGAMSQNPVLADEFTENFNYPDHQWDRIFRPNESMRGSAARRPRNNQSGQQREQADALPDRHLSRAKGCSPIQGLLRGNALAVGEAVPWAEILLLCLSGTAWAGAGSFLHLPGLVRRWRRNACRAAVRDWAEGRGRRAEFRVGWRDRLPFSGRGVRCSAPTRSPFARRHRGS